MPDSCVFVGGLPFYTQVEEIEGQLQKLQYAAEIAGKEKEEAVQIKKDVNEAAKNAQRDAAARIVDFSQKNSKLLAELTSARCKYYRHGG